MDYLSPYLNVAYIHEIIFLNPLRMVQLIMWYFTDILVSYLLYSKHQCFTRCIMNNPEFECCNVIFLVLYDVQQSSDVKLVKHTIIVI